MKTLYIMVLTVLAAGAIILSMPLAVLSADRGASQTEPLQQRDPATDPPGNGAIDRRGQVQDPATPRAEDRQEAEETVEAATRIFMDMQANIVERIPAAVMEGAAGIAIFPDMIRAGLIAGGRYGTGVLLSQTQGEWSPPVFVSIGGASLGAQVGVEASDLILVFRTLDSLNRFLEGEDFRLGVDAAVAAGSSGAQAQMTTQDAEVWAYQRSRGLFAGVALSGVIMAMNDERLRAYYNFNEDQAARGYYAGDAERTRTLLNIGPQEDQQVVQELPESTETLRKALEEYATTEP